MNSSTKTTGTGPETKRVFHLFGAWNDSKEEAWLRRMAKEGWHLEKIGPFTHRFRKGEPADIVYRMDFQVGKFDQKEYFGIFRDAGWEYLGRSGVFYYFRTPAGGGNPEIFTDKASRIAKYQRILLLMFILLIPLFNTSTNVLARHGSGTFWIIIRAVQAVVTLFLVYGLVRILVQIGRLKKSA